MLIMCEGYFFPQNKLKLKDYWLFIPAVVVLAPMFLQAVGAVSLPEGWRSWTVGAVSLLFIAYFMHSVRMALRIRNEVRKADEERYADSNLIQMIFLPPDASPEYNSSGQENWGHDDNSFGSGW